MPSRSEARSLNIVYRLCSNTSSFMKVFIFEIQTLLSSSTDCFPMLYGLEEGNACGTFVMCWTPAHVGHDGFLRNFLFAVWRRLGASSVLEEKGRQSPRTSHSMWPMRSPGRHFLPESSERLMQNSLCFSVSPCWMRMYAKGSLTSIGK